MNDSRTKPNLLQFIPYAYGRTVLPPSMHKWVIQDLAGPGAAWRMIYRFAIPCIIILVPFWFFPASFLVHATMTVPIFVPFVYFSIVLNKIFRRARLRHHGLDPELVDARARVREAELHADYVNKYGPREH